ncbi:MAG TPA: hypothetical protein DCE44_10220, partial [Verrucomicrobiales bacterium]|nr:hypothetical protein [Verrucomicrobiales bacterium]
MNSNAPILLMLALGVAIVGRFPADAEPPSPTRDSLPSSSRAILLAEAQPHRATFLGNPQTRFAPPLERPSDLRARFRDEKLKPDIAVILAEWGWKGNLEDLHYAALTAEITEVQLPYGTRMPFMSSRKDGKPICLRDVIWEGKHPAPAYVFTFSSNGRKYRCVTPKACSNFFIEDLGPELSRLELVKTMPAETSVCDPFEMQLIVRNTGRVILNRIQITDALPAGLLTADQRSATNFDVGTLRPGASREFRFHAHATAAGRYENRAQVTSAEGVGAEATASTSVRAPILALECEAPGQVYLGRPARACLTLRNTGDAAESKATVTLPLPAGAVVVDVSEGGVTSPTAITWELANLAPGANHQMCATLSLPQPGALSLVPEAKGLCAPRVQSACGTRVAGVPGILIEVVDLEDPVEVGNNVVYDIRVLNQGSLPGTNLRLVCTIPASQEFVSATGATSARADGRPVN